MLIYIRHAQDQLGDFQHDEELSTFGKKKAREKAYQLLDEYGIPDYIFYSPFQRTRQTKNEMVKAVKRYKKRYGIQKKIKLEVDPDLGRYFNGKERRYPQVHPDSLKNGAVTDLNKKEFKKRVYHQIFQKRDKGVVWNITHSLVLINAAKFTKVSYPKHVEYLESLVINSDDIPEKLQSFS